MNRSFDRCLRNLLTITDIGREDLARQLGVSAATVRLWERGEAVPDVYQFKNIAACFGLPYGWFLDGPCSRDETVELAERLGLSTDSVEGLLALAERGQEAVLDAVDDAVYAILSAVEAAREEDMDDDEE